MKNRPLTGSVVALALFLASCGSNNGLDNKELEGDVVPVRIRSMSVAEGNSKSLSRSSSQQETDLIPQPIGDGILLEMSIEEEESPLRKTELTPSAYFRVIAVEAGTTKYYSHGDFVYGNPIILLTDFHVQVGKSYDYICFSYNEITNTLPSSADYVEGDPLPTELGIDITGNPLWCRITGMGEVSASGVELDITLNRLLAKVKVKVDCVYNGWKIPSIADDKVAVVSIDPDEDCDIDWKTGVISGTDMDQGLTYTISDITRTDQTSNEVTIIPKGSDAVIKFKANAVSRDGYGTAVPSAEKTATLTVPLSGGASYTIHVRLRTPIWARSNIYWNGSGLDFVEAADDPAENDDDYQGYQGVFFKMGSLVGVSPTGSPFSYSVPVYKAGSSTSSYYSSWDAVPHWDTEIYGLTLNNDHEDALLGDICLYLNPAYRLPVNGEFGVTNSTWALNTEGWEWHGSTQTVVEDATGRYDMIGDGHPYAKNTTADEACFPASGQRTYYYSDHTGPLMNVGAHGTYMTRTFTYSSYDQVYVLSFSGTTVNANTSVHYILGGSVRCVKK